MAMSALIVVVNVLGTIYLMLNRPPANVFIGLVILGSVCFHAGVWFVIYRLGQGLTNCEKSAVHGLTVIYLLLAALSGGIGYSYPDYATPSLIGLGVLSLFFLPPILVGYLHWRDLYET